MKKACFFDRDGIINEMVFDQESGSIHIPLNVSQVILDYAISSTLQETKKLGYLNIIISNQPNVGLQQMSMETFKEIDSLISKKLNQQGVVIDKEYFCFHHPYSHLLEFKKDCDCRKPKMGLFLTAAKEFNIDLQKSWMIGDGVYDIIAGKKAGCKTIFVSNAANETGYYRKLMEKLNGIEPDFIVKNTREVLSVVRDNL